MFAILIKHFYSKNYEYLCRSAQQKIVVNFFCNKTKTKAFLDNRGHDFLVIEYNCPKTKFPTKLIWFRTVGAPEILEGIEKLGSNREQFAWQIFYSFLCFFCQYLKYKLWGNNKSCWSVGNIMPEIKRFKNTSEGLVIP